MITRLFAWVQEQSRAVLTLLLRPFVQHLIAVLLCALVAMSMACMLPTPAPQVLHPTVAAYDRREVPR